MDTYVTILIMGKNNVASPALDKAFDRMQEIDAKFNSLNPKSPIYAFNNFGVPITDPELLKIINLSLDISRRTNGAFDITIAPIVELWGFYSGAPSLPENRLIRQALRNVNYKYLIVKNDTLIKTNNLVKIDMGSIAKGYSVSEAARILKEEGVNSAIIDAGGDVFTIGKKRNKKLWKIGIKNPRGENLLGHVEFENLSVACSGDYERFFILDGKRYHHIFNPKTGYPAEGIMSVTVIYPDPTLTDAWTTAFFVLGQEKTLKLVEEIPEMECLIVTSSGKTLFSSNFEDSMKFSVDKIN